MNPMILKIISSPINCQGGNNGRVLKSVKGTGDFFASIRKSLNSAQKKPFHHPARPAQTGPALKKGYKFAVLVPAQVEHWGAFETTFNRGKPSIMSKDFSL